MATEAFARSAVVEVTLLIGMAPVLALGIERLQGRRVPSQRLLGVFLAVGGLMGFLAPGGVSVGVKLSGDMFALGAAAASAIYATRLRQLARSNSAPDAIYVAGLACLAGALGGAGLASALGSLTYQALTPHDARMFLLLGTLSTAIPTAAYSVASIRLPAVLTTSLGLVTPLFAALFAGTVLGEWPALSTLPGALTALVGLALVVRSEAAS
jgi:drug/metabolite transporter (DMT)-like permease